MFFQLIITSLIAGSIYALVASGFSLIYATNKFMHFAHGISIAIGAYLLYTFHTLLNMWFLPASILAILTTALLGVGMYWAIYRLLRNNNASNTVLLIASLALLILFENILQLFFSAQVKSIGLLQTTEGLALFGARITPLQITIIITSIVIFLSVHILMKRSSLGRNMRAVADNTELASIVGINNKKVSAYSFLLGSGLAGIAGILIGLEQNLTPIMGTSLMVRGFAAAIIGGVGSVPGAILGSYLLGFVENFGIWWLPSSYKDAIMFGLLFLFLLFKPNGLLGVDLGVKK